MKTLFVEKEATELNYERQVILIYKAGKRISSVPVAGLDRVVISPHITLKAGVLGLLTENNIALFVFNARHPRRSAYLATGEIGGVHRRIAQYELLKDHTSRLDIATRIIAAKIHSQRKLLKQSQLRRPELRKPLHDAITSLNEACRKLQTPCKKIATLRGIEGAAAASYFSAYKKLFPACLGFNSRNRRPPKDPVNAMLSLAYTLLYHESISALKSAGLDPMIGCYHEIYHGRASLACDLAEMQRSEIESWVLKLCQMRKIRQDHFKYENNACLLNAKGKMHFYESYLGTVPIWRNRLRRYSRLFANHIDKEKANV